MRKLRLDMDDLRVESFETSAGESGAGTVRGHELTVNRVTDRTSTSCGQVICDRQTVQTCVSCGDGCSVTCFTCPGQATLCDFTCEGEASCATVCVETCYSDPVACCI